MRDKGTGPCVGRAEGLGSKEQDWETGALCRVCAEVKESEVEGGCWGKEEPRGVAEDLRGWHRDEKGLAGEFYLLAG